jgi:membrane-bound lytic murein transglycosylase B
MLRGTASTAVRRLRFPRRAASGLVAIMVGLAAGGVVGLGVVTADSSSTPVTRAVLSGSHGSLFSPDATAATFGTEQPTAPSGASVVTLTGSGRLARAALTAGDIPPSAWAAYLRAAAVMAQAAPRCELDWTVLAAIGLAESDHGRDLPPTGGSATAPGAAGRSAPDSDAGQLDGDPHHDVPVGPMRLLPSTWQVIGVDGDGDGVRSPTDIDDAALAVGVALCAGDARLGTADGLRAALLRFAPSPAYVDLILRLARAYAQGAFGTPTSIDVTAVAHPVVTDTRTTLAGGSLARRVEAAQAAAAESVGMGTSAAAQLLATATASTAPGAPVAGGASLSLTDPDAPGVDPLAPVSGPVTGPGTGPGTGPVTGSVASSTPDPTSPTSSSGGPSGGTTSAETPTGSPTAGPTTPPPPSPPNPPWPGTKCNAITYNNPTA